MVSSADAPTSENPAGTVRLIGAPQIVDARGAVIGGVPSGRATLLLQRLAIAAGASVSLDELVDTLWPSEAPPSAPRTVAALVSRVRAALGPSVLIGQPTDGYRFGIEHGWTTDLLEAEALADTARRRARTAPALAASASRRALEMLGSGRLLGAIPRAVDTWYDTAERRIDVLIGRLRRIGWEAEGRLGRWYEVVLLAEEALALDPIDESAARALMVAHAHLGDRGSALRVHDRLRGDLDEALGVDPSPETADLHLAVLRGETPTMPTEDRDAAAPDRLTIGREAEFAQLVETWETASAGRCTVVLVTGAPGSGRGRLSEALREVAAETGGRVIHARSVEGERSSFLRPLLRLASQLLLSTPESELRDLLGSWAPVAAELLPEVAPLLPSVTRRPSSPDLTHHRALQLLSHVLGRAASSRPLLLALDDVHRASAATLDAISWLLTELADSPILMLGTASVEEPLIADDELQRHVRTILLRPLDRAAVTRLVTTAGHADRADVVWELTHGHLRFVIAVVELLDRGIPLDEIPASFHHLVETEIESWEPEQRTLLQTASLIGTAFDLGILEALTERRTHEIQPILDRAVTGGHLAEDGPLYVFVNDEVHETLRLSVAGPAARRHHLRLAEILRDQPERRAWHLDAAGRQDLAAPAWLAAARSALLVFAHGDAERLATAAITAASAIGDDGVLAEALLDRGTAREHLGDYDGAVEDHERAGQLWLRTGDRSLRARSLERLGWTAYYRRDRDEAVRRSEQVVDLPGTHPGAWALLGRVRHWSGDLTESTEAYRHALRDLDDDPASRVSVLSCLGALYAHSDRFEDAIEVLDEAVEVANDIGAFRPLLRTLFFRGLAQANQGRLSDALTTFATKSALLDRYGVRYYRARTNTSIAWVWRELGDVERSAELSELALEQSLEVDDEVLQFEQELHARCSLADVAMFRGDLDAAAEHLEACRAVLEEWMPFRWRAELRVVEIGARIGLDDPEHLLVIARERRSAKYETLALHLLGRTDEAARSAAATGSDLLLAEVDAGDEGRRARDRLLGALPTTLRREAARRGRLFGSDS